MPFSIRAKHRPIHFYQDKTYYFVTLRTINRVRYFDSDFKKHSISAVIRKAADKFKVKIFAWVVLDNHIHLLFLLPDGSILPGFMHNINANISRTTNKIDNLKGRKIFKSYWDYCIRNKKDFFLHFNYIHHNPVKHGYIKSQQKCCKYEFCSYKDWVKKNGEEWINDCFKKYSVRDFTVEE